MKTEIINFKHKLDLTRFRVTELRIGKLKNNINKPQDIIFLIRYNLENKIDAKLLRMWRVGIVRTQEFLEFEESW